MTASPDDTASAGVPMEQRNSPDIGPRVREFRALRGYSVRKLAAACELSPSFISQLENGLASPSVRSLLRICSVLHLNLGDLLSYPANDRGALREDDRQAIPVGEGARKFLLTRKPIRYLEVYQFELEPGAETGPPEAYGDSQALLLVTRGVAAFALGAEETLLEENDSIEFTTSVPHSIANRGTCKLVAIIALKAVTAPPD